MSKKRITLHMAWNYRKILAKKTHEFCNISDLIRDTINEEIKKREISYSPVK